MLASPTAADRASTENSSLFITHEIGPKDAYVKDIVSSQLVNGASSPSLSEIKYAPDTRQCTSEWQQEKDMLKLCPGAPQRARSAQEETR